jgi:hypothetical protein
MRAATVDESLQGLELGLNGSLFASIGIATEFRNNSK